MKVIAGESLDGIPSNKQHGSFQYARNLATSDDHKASRNAFGFEVKKLLTNDNETLDIVGKEETIKGVFIFGNLTSGQGYATIYWYNPNDNSVKIVLKTAKFNWSLDNLS